MMNFNNLIELINTQNLTSHFYCEDNTTCDTLMSMSTEIGLMTQKNSIIFKENVFYVYWINHNSYHSSLELKVNFFPMLVSNKNFF